MKSTVACLSALVLLLATAAVAGKVRIERLDDLPRHTYRVEGRAVDLLRDEQKLLALGEELVADLLADLEQFDLADRTTLKSYYQSIGTLAIMRGRYDEYFDYLARTREIEDKEAQRLMVGMIPSAWIAAIRDPETPFEKAFDRELRARVNNLPYETVGAAVKQQKGMMEIVTPALLEGMVESSVQPVLDKSGGELTKEMAEGLLGQGFAVHYLLPHRETIAAVLADYLAAHAVEKVDIWRERDVDLGGRDDLSEVVIGVWDSGVDAPIFVGLGQAWTNPQEVAGNGIDDDGNGFVDDVHGIGYDLHANRIAEPLYAVEAVEDRALLQRRMKGLRDVQNAIDSPEAVELKRAMSEMTQEEVKPFLEGISAYGNHSHGTHVAGIAAAGNPAARLLSARLTYGHTIIPEKPTLEQARREAAMYLETAAYFRARGVRVVNMSWGGSISDVEEALAAHDDPSDPVARKALAREIFDLGKAALTEAMASSPSILFCVAAGNSNNDNVFEEFIPSSIELPNVITVGAVDQAGDETSFTTFGKVDVCANGFDVESYVPGGDRLGLSGTSMAAPQVANAAAKLLAVRPELDPVRLKAILVETADEHLAGDRAIRLLHPRRALERASSGAGR